MLTSQDLEQIEKLLDKKLDKHEGKILSTFEQKFDNLDSKIDQRADQIIEYLNANMEAHETWLKDHEVRLNTLEENGYTVNDREKKE